MLLEDDPRWRLFNTTGFVCANCQRQHVGIFDLGSARPDVAMGNVPVKPNGALDLGGTFLSEDFCVVEGSNFLIRTVLELPIHGSSEVFGFGVWSTLSRENFERYVDGFDEGRQEQLGPMFSWLATVLKGYPETFSLKSRVHPRDGRTRPTVELNESDHPLSLEQRDGISFDRLLEIYAINGHDLRPHLTQPG